MPDDFARGKASGLTEGKVNTIHLFPNHYLTKERQDQGNGGKRGQRQGGDQDGSGPMALG